LLFWLSCPPSVSWYGSFDNYCIFKMNAVTGDNLYVQKMCTFCGFWQCAVMLFLLFVWKCVSLQECACMLVTDFSKPSGDVYCNIHILVFSLTTFSALTLLVGRQEGHPTCKKNWAVGCSCGCLPGARCRLTYGPADATATHCLLLQ